jgi:ketosteroid isomerase-like protein
VGKAEIADWIVPLHANPGERYDCELTKKAVRAFGDVVVVHYLVRDFFRDAESDRVVRELDTYRITHTWQRRGDTWQIITGMSGAQAGK